MKPKKRTFRRRRLDQMLADAAVKWGDAMGPYLRELTEAAADDACSAFVAEHPSTPVDDARRVFRAEAAHRSSRLEQAVTS